MFKPGDVVLIRSAAVGKPKFHLCVSLDRWFLFLNTYKGRDYPGNIVVPCSEFPFLTPTESGKSVVCCSTVLRLSESEVGRALLKGRATIALLRRIVAEVESSVVLSEEHREIVLDGLGDWL